MRLIPALVLCAWLSQGRALLSQPISSPALPNVSCPSGRLVSDPEADQASALLALGGSRPEGERADLYSHASQLAERSLLRSERNAYSHYLAGTAAIGLAEFGEADRHFRRALELCPALGGYDVNRLRAGAASLAVDRASRRLESADTSAAIADLTAALRLDPDRYPAEFYLGTIAFMRAATDDAVRHWSRVIEILDTPGGAGPTTGRVASRVNTLNALVLASAQYLNRDRPGAAAELLARLTAQLPQNPEAWYNYALALHHLQRWEDLTAVARRATELAPLSYGAWVLHYNAYAGRSQAAMAAGDTAAAGELGARARQISERGEALPLQVQGVTVDVEDRSTRIEGTAVGKGSAAPVQLEFTLYGPSGSLGTGRVTIAPTARDLERSFQLEIQSSGPVSGVTYRLVP